MPTIGSGLQFEGDRGIIADSYEHALSAFRSTAIPNNLQTLLAYNGNDIQYVGSAPKGLGESSSGWILYNLSYSSGNLVSKKVAFDSWSNRATASYE